MKMKPLVPLFAMGSEFCGGGVARSYKGTKKMKHHQGPEDNPDDDREITEEEWINYEEEPE